jgi:hypothetical protein
VPGKVIGLELPQVAGLQHACGEGGVVPAVVGSNSVPSGQMKGVLALARGSVSPHVIPLQQAAWLGGLMVLLAG